MNNPNPFIPQGSLLDQQHKRRTRMKLGVFCVLAVSVTGLMAMLIQGCKRQPAENADNPMPDTNDIAAMDTNQPSMDLSNEPPMMSSSTNMAPIAQTPVIPTMPPAAPEGTEYVVVKGDTLARIAKAHGVTVKALENANPNVQPTRLKVGDKLIVPSGGSAPASGASTTAAGATSGSSDTTTYVVKSGDTLSKIAKAHGTTIKAIESANGLSTTKIKVGQKLKIPVKVEASAPAPAEAPVAPAPAATSAPVPAPAPAH